MTVFTPIIHDTLKGAIVVSIFDFFACFFVLFFISLILKVVSSIVKITEPKKEAKET